ncbi:PIG-L deacetylase family protein [Paenibacillus tundrae]|uniref:LmbE family N-acetylglucosaminyl deacetylase n=1 Tax=Paenibacillus tundrae TaxID=528187 RepID=A0ABT9WJC3_9BACL|nr:PIG-L deacetylase family protein [Paenibacillus tundrae]MDQ0173378.1 LmbE family N-acetylglucosaminyl deacetylase [Paenibacillus tundrae]
MIKKRNLIITAHPDDAEITMGGTIKKMTTLGHEVKNLIICLPSEPEIRIDEAKKSAKLLGMDVEFLEKNKTSIAEDHTLFYLITKLDRVIEEYQPDSIYTHFIKDSHQDHRIVAQAVLTCFRKHKCDLLSFEQINQNNLITSNQFIPNLYVDISEYFQEKIKSLEIHKSQMVGHMTHYLIDVEKLAEWRGHQSGNRYAESFLIIHKKDF